MRISTEMNFGFLKGALFTAAESSSSSTGSKDSAAVSSSGGASDTTAADTVDYAKYAAMGAGTYVLGNGDTLLVLSDTARATVEAINSMLTYLGAGPETATSSSSSAAASSSSASALKKTSAVSSTEVVSSTGSLISDIPILKQMNVSAVNHVTEEYIYLGVNKDDGSSKYSIKRTNVLSGYVDYDTVTVTHPSANVLTMKAKEFGEVTNYVFTNKGINVYEDGSFLYTITKNPAKSNGIVLTNNEDGYDESAYATVDTKFYPVVTSA